MLALYGKTQAPTLAPPLPAYPATCVTRRKLQAPFARPWGTRRPGCWGSWGSWGNWLQASLRDNVTFKHLLKLLVLLLVLVAGGAVDVWQNPDIVAATDLAPATGDALGVRAHEFVYGAIPAKRRNRRAALFATLLRRPPELFARGCVLFFRAVWLCVVQRRHVFGDVLLGGVLGEAIGGCVRRPPTRRKKEPTQLVRIFWERAWVLRRANMLKIIPANGSCVLLHRLPPACLPPASACLACPRLRSHPP